MLAIPSTPVLREGWDTLQRSAAAVRGLPSASATLDLIRLSQQHRGLSNGVLSGNAGMVAPREAKQAEVQRALKVTQEAVSALGSAELSRLAAGVTQDWQALAAAVSARDLPVPQSFARHTAMIARQLELLEDIANRSGIVVEDDAANDFLQAALLRNLPLATEALGQMRARGSALLTRGEASAEDRAHFEALLHRLQTALHDTQRLLALSGQHDAPVQAALAAPLSTLRESSASALKLVSDEIL